MILAIDPGPVESAICYYGEHITAAKLENEKVIELLKRHHMAPVAIEMIASYGMPVGAEVFNTCVWIGRFIQAHGGTIRLVYRREVKLHLCGSMKAKDPNVRQALLDRFGSQGTKKAPGILYGFSGDMWSALAVALTATETAPMLLKNGGQKNGTLPQIR